VEEYVIALELNIPHWIYLNEQKTEGVTVTFFDANHILGAVMILFQGKMGTILHTGDFRYTPQMLNNNIIFPLKLRNDQYRQIAIDIDHLILDNTFCDPTSNHPSKDDAFRMIVEIVEKHRDHKIVVFMYKSGKEEIVIKLARIFETTVSALY